jgi:hypothetical protein
VDIGVKAVTFAVFAGLLTVYVIRDLGSTSLLRAAAEPVLGRFPVLRLLVR